MTRAILGMTSTESLKRPVTLVAQVQAPCVVRELHLPSHYTNVIVESISRSRDEFLTGDVPATMFHDSVCSSMLAGFVIYPTSGISIRLRRVSRPKWRPIVRAVSVRLARGGSYRVVSTFERDGVSRRERPVAALLVDLAGWEGPSWI